MKKNIKDIHGYKVYIDSSLMTEVGDKENSYLLYGKETFQDYTNELSAELKDAYIKCKDYSKIETKGESYIRRYFLWNSLNNEDSIENKVTIILLNPAFACSDFLDATLKRAKYLLENDLKQSKIYSSFAVLNLTSIRQPKSGVLPALLEKFQPLEDDKKFIEEYIEANINSNMDYILAWGNNECNIICNDHIKMSQFVLKCLSSATNKKAGTNLYIYLNRLTGKENPPHFNQQGFNSMKKNYNDIKIQLTPVSIFESNKSYKLNII